MNRTLTIVGASVRAAAQSAVRGGFSVHSGDLFADVDVRKVSDTTRVTNYPRGLAAVLTRPHPGGWMYTGALENHPLLVGRWAALRPLWGNDASVIRSVRDPWRVTHALRSAGLLAPDIAVKGTHPPRDGDWLFKSLRSAGGSQVFHWDKRTPSPDMRGRRYFQRYVEGPSYSGVYVAAGGQSVLLGVSRQLTGLKWTGSEGFRYCGSIGLVELPAGIMQDFVEVGAVLAAEFKLVGLFGVDAIVNTQGVWPVEVNPRFTASTELVDWARGISTVQHHVAACRDGLLPRDLPGASRVCGKAIVFASRSLVVDANLSSAADEDNGWAALADIPAVGTTTEAGGPIATVMAEGSSEAQVLAKLRCQAADMRASLGDNS